MFFVNGSITSRIVNAQASNSKVDLGDTYIYFSQSTTLPRIVDNGTDQNLIVCWDGLTIDNPNGNLPDIYGNSAFLVAGSRFGRATITGGLTALCQSKTDADVQPFISGEIRDLANRKVWSAALPRSISIVSGSVQVLNDWQAAFYTNTGAHTILAPISDGKVSILITNSAAGAGAIATSGFSNVSGDSFTTTPLAKFLCNINRTNGISSMVVKTL